MFCSEQWQPLIETEEKALTDVSNSLPANILLNLSTRCAWSTRNTLPLNVYNENHGILAITHHPTIDS